MFRIFPCVSNVIGGELHRASVECGKKLSAESELRHREPESIYRVALGGVHEVTYELWLLDISEEQG